MARDQNWNTQVRGVTPAFLAVRGWHLAGGTFFTADDVKTIIKWKDIHEALEEAIDACEEVSNVIGNIVLKNA